MTAEILREAAALMRERAEAATHGPWGVDEVGAVWTEEADGQPVPIFCRATDQDAEHIASWHPTVALAVADWLDGAYNAAVTAAPTTAGEMEAALAVARAYLGSSA